MLGSIVHQRTPCLLDDLTLIQKEIRFRIHILQWCIISVGSSYYYRINPICIFIISDSIHLLRKKTGAVVIVRLFSLQLPVQSVPITTKVVSAWRGVLYTTLDDKVCQWLATGWWFSLGTPFSFTNKTDRHDIAEVALNTIKPTIGKQFEIIVGCIIFNKHVSMHQ